MLYEVITEGQTEPEEITESESVAEVLKTIETAKKTVTPVMSVEHRFYSPLVKNIAKQEGVSQTELDAIPGTGMDNRVTKNDIMAYLGQRGTQPEAKPQPIQPLEPVKLSLEQINGTEQGNEAPIVTGEDEIVEMTRMGKLVAKHMIESVQISAHVQRNNFV